MRPAVPPHISLLVARFSLLFIDLWMTVAMIRALRFVTHNVPPWRNR